jgi:hypothetical protein
MGWFFGKNHGFGNSFDYLSWAGFDIQSPDTKVCLVYGMFNPQFPWKIQIPQRLKTDAEEIIKLEVSTLTLERSSQDGEKFIISNSHLNASLKWTTSEWADSIVDRCRFWSLNRCQQSDEILRHLLDAPCSTGMQGVCKFTYNGYKVTPV